MLELQVIESSEYRKYDYESSNRICQFDKTQQIYMQND